MKNELISALALTLLILNEGCKKKEEDPAPVVSQRTFRSTYPTWGSITLEGETSDNVITGTGFGTGYDSVYGLFTCQGKSYKIRFISKYAAKVQPTAANGYHLNGWEDSVNIRTSSGGSIDGILGRYTYNSGREYILLNISTPKTSLDGPFSDSL